MQLQYSANRQSQRHRLCSAAAAQCTAEAIAEMGMMKMTTPEPEPKEPARPVHPLGKPKGKKPKKEKPVHPLGKPKGPKPEEPEEPEAS